MNKRKLYPDYSYAPGDMVVEMIPYPNQEDNAFDDGPRLRYKGRRGTFIGNLQEYGQSSLIKVGNEEVEVIRRELSFDAVTDFKSPAFIERHQMKEIRRLELIIKTIEDSYMKERSELERQIKKALASLEKK